MPSRSPGPETTPCPSSRENPAPQP
jgi:hypothetical protein